MSVSLDRANLHAGSCDWQVVEGRAARAADAANFHMILAQTPLLFAARFAEAHESGAVTPGVGAREWRACSAFWISGVRQSTKPGFWSFATHGMAARWFVGDRKRFRH
jgi:hypothetical protein